MRPGPDGLLRRRLTAAVAVTAAAVLLVLHLTSVEGSTRSPGVPRSPGVASSVPFAGRLLVYGRHALTPAQVTALSAAAAGPVTAVHGGEVAVLAGPAGYPSVPVQAFTVDPRSYAAAAGTPSLATALSRGLVLSTRGAALRHSHVGDQLPLQGRRRPVTAVVPDALLGGYELATSPAVLGAQAGPGASYLLVAQGKDARATARRLRAALPGTDLRVESRTRNGLMSSADTVLTQAQVKKLFGEFAVRVDGSGALHLDSGWQDRWIASAHLPQLGNVTCNRAVLGPLRAAMEEITRRGLGALVHTADFQREGGCWSPRVVRLGAGQLSSHAWGIAVDINVDVNPLGARPVQDPRLVDVMARHGFTWGGLWLRPDGAHFEWGKPSLSGAGR
jgi:hypothetical protein